jgi:hypothetical protein
MVQGWACRIPASMLCRSASRLNLRLVLNRGQLQDRPQEIAYLDLGALSCLVNVDEGTPTPWFEANQMYTKTQEETCACDSHTLHEKLEQAAQEVKHSPFKLIQCGCGTACLIGSERKQMPRFDDFGPRRGDLERCEIPPPGWDCSRAPGHEGPCAARKKTMPKITIADIVRWTVLGMLVLFIVLGLIFGHHS